MCLHLNCYKEINVKCVHLYRIFSNVTFFFTDLRQKLYSELASDEAIQVSRESVLPDLLRCYDNDDVVSSTIKVTFTDEEGEDCGGLTQDMFSAFWEQAFDMHFDGEEIKVPFASPSNLHCRISYVGGLGTIGVLWD